MVISSGLVARSVVFAVVQWARGVRLRSRAGVALALSAEARCASLHSCRDSRQPLRRISGNDGQLCSPPVAL